MIAVLDAIGAHAKDFKTALMAAIILLAIAGIYFSRGWRL